MHPQAHLQETTFTDRWAAPVLYIQTLLQKGAEERPDTAPLLALLEEFDNVIQAAARRFQVPPHERADLLQEAYIGFLKAVYSFDPRVGAPFAAYAKSKTHEAVWQCIRVRNRRLTRELADGHGSSGDDEGGHSLLDRLPDPHTDGDFSELEWRSLLSSLSEREALAVEKIVIDGLSMADLARQEGVSPGTVKTWKQRAFQKIRAELNK